MPSPQEVAHRLWQAHQRAGGADPAPRPDHGQQGMARPPARVVDERGREVKLTSAVKNRMFREAKGLREEVRSAQLTKSECWNASPENVAKMRRNEMSPEGRRLKERFNNLMRAQGAPAGECLAESLRRRR